MRDIHYCKWCRTQFFIDIPDNFTGDALVVCPTDFCGYKHPRQFVGGIAVSCDPPSRKPLIIEAVK